MRPLMAVTSAALIAPFSVSLHGAKPQLLLPPVALSKAVAATSLTAAGRTAPRCGGGTSACKNSTAVSAPRPPAGSKRQLQTVTKTVKAGEVYPVLCWELPSDILK